MSPRTGRSSRRFVLRSFAALALSAVPAVRLIGRVSAQTAADPSFSDTILPTLGLPEINLEQYLTGVKGVPASLPAGTYLVNYKAVDAVGYLLFAQYPAGTPMEQALDQAKQAGSYDQQQKGWVYGGGTYATPGTTVQVVVELSAGDWNVVTSHMPEGGDFATEENYEIVPLPVTEATPAAASPVPMITADVNVELPGMAFTLDHETIKTGPKLWQFTNTSDQSHHIVIQRIPRAIDGDDINDMVNAFMTGTPPAGDAWFTQAIWSGYTALFSPGQSVWNEFDFDPGHYVLLCYISDIETGKPHLMMGMWQNFTVEA